jgi:hypothetical protein
VPSPWIALAARTDLNLVRAAISSQGRYYDSHRTIVMRDDLLIEEERRHLWHELVHADRRDRVGHMDAKVERLVDRHAAENAMPWESIRWAWDRATDLTEMAGLLNRAPFRVSKERDGMISPEVQRTAIADYAAAAATRSPAGSRGSTSPGPAPARHGGHGSTRPSPRSRPGSTTSSWSGSTPASHATGCGGRSRSTASRTPAAGWSPPPSSSTPPPARGRPRPRDARRAPGLRGRADRGGVEGSPRLTGCGPGSRPTGSRSGATPTTGSRSCTSRTRRPGRCSPTSTAATSPASRSTPGAVAQRPRVAHDRRDGRGRTGRCAGSSTPGSRPAGSCRRPAARGRPRAADRRPAVAGLPRRPRRTPSSARRGRCGRSTCSPGWCGAAAAAGRWWPASSGRTGPKYRCKAGKEKGPEVCTGGYVMASYLERLVLEDLTPMQTRRRRHGVRRCGPRPAGSRARSDASRTRWVGLRCSTRSPRYLSRSSGAPRKSSRQSWPGCRRRWRMRSGTCGGRSSAPRRRRGGCWSRGRRGQSNIGVRRCVSGSSGRSGCGQGGRGLR